MLAYEFMADLLACPPAAAVGMVVLATNDGPGAVARALHWLRYRYRCPMVVVGDEGHGPQERAARAGGACYLTRPVHEEEWTGVLEHAFGDRRAARRSANIARPSRDGPTLKTWRPDKGES
jgi:hypothetical protein